MELIEAKGESFEKRLSDGMDEEIDGKKKVDGSRWVLWEESRVEEEFDYEIQEMITGLLIIQRLHFSCFLFGR